MFQNKKQFEVLGKGFCAAPAPLLWKGLFLLIPILTLVLIGISFSMARGIYKNRKHRKEIWDKENKKKLLYFSVLSLSLLTYGVVGLNFDFYLLVFFMVSLWILSGFFMGEHLKLFRLRKEWWMLMTVLTLLFATLFAFCYVEEVRGSISNQKSPQASCPSRILF